MTGISQGLATGIGPRPELEPEYGKHLGHPNDADVLDLEVLVARHGRLRQADRPTDVCQAEAAVQPSSPRLAHEITEDRASASSADGGWSLLGGHPLRMQDGHCLGLIRPAAVLAPAGIAGG